MSKRIQNWKQVQVMVKRKLFSFLNLNVLIVWLMNACLPTLSMVAMSFGFRVELFWEKADLEKFFNFLVMDSMQLTRKFQFTSEMIETKLLIKLMMNIRKIVEPTADAMTRKQLLLAREKLFICNYCAYSK